MKVKKGDKVVIMSGKDKGIKSEISRVINETRKVVVTSVNIVKKHVKPSRENPEGGILEFEKPIDVSNVMLVCASCQKPTRVGVRREKGKKIRFCKKCEALIA